MSKFRLWDKRFSEFEEDFFVSKDGKIYKKSTDTGYGIAISRETSEEVVLMQSTDIKDKNGKEIFEFDVVSLSQFGELKPLVGVVKRMEGRWVVDTGSLAMALWSEIEETEILGNMFENPDLIPY